MFPHSALTSQSVGDPTRFVDGVALRRAVHVLQSPRQTGTVTMLLARGPGGVRQRLEAAVLTPLDGMPGDAWGRKRRKSLDNQLTAMETQVAQLLANGQDPALAGDNLLLDFDLSQAHLPAGTLLQVGAAVLVVGAMSHDGCSKFRKRFGADALQLTLAEDMRHRRLRGIHLHVAQAGLVRVGDAVSVLTKP